MAERQPDPATTNRVILLTLGALAGLAAWALLDVLPRYIDNDRLLLLIAAAAGGFFSACLAAVGPLRPLRAALAAALAALPAAALLYWASGRFARAEDFIETVHPPVAFIVIVSILLPFLIAAQRPDEGWRHYPALFTEAWNIVVRYAAAWLFTGVFWAALGLSDALFGLVGLDIIEELLDIDWVPFVLTGAVLGLAMAVVVELSDYLSPFLILRLLRLLLPLFLVVSVVFLVALPVQGLSDLFGGLSAAATLMAMVFGSATLITSALDRTDADAVAAPVMRLSTQALALALPVMAGLALYAIWLRVEEYGLSPDRLAAAAAGLVAAAYALSYAGAVLLRGNWMRHIRGANIAVALGAVALAALWLTPLIDPQRISARDQLSRFAAGEVSAERLDLWFIGKELGLAGEAALAELAAMEHPQKAALQTRLDKLSASATRYGFQRDELQADLPALRAELAGRLVVRPEGAEATPALFARFRASRLRDLNAACARTTPRGNPGCVLIRADLVPARAGDEALLFYLAGAGAALRVIWADGTEAPHGQPVFLQGDRTMDVTPALLDRLVAGDFRLAPAEVITLQAGDATIFVAP